MVSKSSKFEKNHFTGRTPWKARLIIRILFNDHRRRRIPEDLCHPVQNTASRLGFFFFPLDVMYYIPSTKFSFFFLLFKSFEDILLYIAQFKCVGFLGEEIKYTKRLEM